MEMLHTYLLLFHFMTFNTFFFPAAEVVGQAESTKQRTDLLLLPSPMLSPSFSSDEDSVYSPNTLVQDFQLDDLFDWDGQQQSLGTF